MKPERLGLSSFRQVGPISAMFEGCTELEGFAIERTVAISFATARIAQPRWLQFGHVFHALRQRALALMMSPQRESQRAQVFHPSRIQQATALFTW